MSFCLSNTFFIKHLLKFKYVPAAAEDFIQILEKNFDCRVIWSVHLSVVLRYIYYI